MTYIDSLPEDAIPVKEYGRHQFENYFYSNGRIYHFENDHYKLLRNNVSKNGYRYACLINQYWLYVNVIIRKFEKNNNLPITY